MYDLISRQALCEYVLNQKDKSVTPNDIMRFPSAQPGLDSENLVRMIENGINATNSNDAYSLGMRNGMRWCKSLIDGAEPKFEDVTDSAELPSAQHEPSIPVAWIEQHIEWLKSLDNGFSTLTATQISAMVKKWRNEQNDV